MIVVNGEYPKDCLHCKYRHCLHIDDKCYQMCGLNGDGYLTESWFKSEDLVDGFKSKHCPIQGEYEDVFNHDLFGMDIDYLLEKKEIMESEDKCIKCANNGMIDDECAYCTNHNLFKAESEDKE